MALKVMQKLNLMRSDAVEGKEPLKTRRFLGHPPKSFPPSLARLFEPPAFIENSDLRRRMRLLLAVDFVLIFGNIIALFFIITLIEGSDKEKIVYLLPSLSTMILGAIALYFAKTPHYTLGVLLTVAATEVNAYGAILATPGPSALTYTGLTIAGVLVAGLFFSVRRTAQIALVIVVGLALVFIVHEPLSFAVFNDYETIDDFSLVVSLIVVSGVSMTVLLFMRLRDLMEADRLAAREQALEKEKMAEMYRRANEVKSAFLANMSHELRTPLNAIINLPTFVVNGEFGPVNDEQKYALETMVESGKHLLNLINDVLDMSKIEAGMLRLFLTDDIDIGDLIRRSASIGQSLIYDKPVVLQVDVPADLPRIRGDQQRIYQVLLNILSNAAKFTEEGSIRISAKLQGDQVEIAVMDTGPGIAPEDQAAVFEAFQQTEAGLRHGGGTGLGMPISKRLVEAHGGRIWLESSVGQGTTFFVRLPLQAEIVEA